MNPFCLQNVAMSLIVNFSVIVCSRKVVFKSFRLLGDNCLGGVFGRG